MSRTDQSLSADTVSESRWPHVIVITGPTASGKSAAAIEVAKNLGAEIVSADSRQVFRGIPITTAAPSADELAAVRHHLVGFLNLDAYYSAAMFREDALQLLREAALRGDRYVVVCGGSMMYVDALLYGLDDLPDISDEVRARVAAIHRDNGLEGVLAFLGNLDPDFADYVDVANPRRVMHALELCLSSGKKLSEMLTGKNRTETPFTYSKFVLRMPREELFGRINRRVDAMVAAGMESEARSVYHLRSLNSLNTIGFKEWFACFDGVMDRETAIARIAKNTRVFAKKQLTWLARRDDNIYVDAADAASLILKEIASR